MMRCSTPFLVLLLGTSAASAQQATQAPAPAGYTLVWHDEFDREDRFLDVGGNSHRVVALHMRLEARWPGAISVGLLFDLDTVAAQAAALPADPAHPAESADSAQSIPLAFEV